jgi:hypothetical protein
MSAQANGILSHLPREVTLEQVKQHVNKYDIDMIAVLEACVNWAHFASSETIFSWFDTEV